MNSRCLDLRWHLGLWLAFLSSQHLYPQSDPPAAPPKDQWEGAPARVSILRGLNFGLAVKTHRIERGHLSVLVLDNSHSPEVLGGVDTLINRQDAPNFDAFDPDSRAVRQG